MNSLNKMPSYRETQLCSHCPSSATDYEQEEDPEFPPIRIGNDIPLVLIPPNAPHQNRYCHNAEEAAEEKAQELEASNSSTISGGPLNISKSLNKPLTANSSKKVNLRGISRPQS